jgi:hypothetical protein
VHKSQLVHSLAQGLDELAGFVVVPLNRGAFGHEERHEILAVFHNKIANCGPQRRHGRRIGGRWFEMTPGACSSSKPRYGQVENNGNASFISPQCDTVILMELYQLGDFRRRP